MDKIIQIPTEKDVFLACLKGKPIDLTGGYEHMSDHDFCLGALCSLGIIHEASWGNHFYVSYPIKVTKARQNGEMILDRGREIQKHGLFFGRSPVYKKWPIG